MTFDSRLDTHAHIDQVRDRMMRVVKGLLARIQVHDASKLLSPEVEIFDEFTPKLAETTYGSDAYRGFLEAMKPALDHHYAENSHHPEHFSEGIRGMNLLDVTEMLCDWCAAAGRMKDGDVRRSIETINQDRFGYGDELKAILLNTLEVIEDGRREEPPR